LAGSVSTCWRSLACWQKRKKAFTFCKPLSPDQGPR
jgi:hypothetical protein